MPRTFSLPLQQGQQISSVPVKIRTPLLINFVPCDIIISTTESQKAAARVIGSEGTLLRRAAAFFLSFFGFIALVFPGAMLALSYLVIISYFSLVD